MKSIYLDSRYPQPIDGGKGLLFEKKQELIDYLPNTNVRIWYSSFNQFFPDHWHEAMEIIYCESGYYVMKTEEYTFEVRPGDALFMPGGSAHSLNMQGDCHGFVYLISLALLDHMPSGAAILPLLSQPLYIKKEQSVQYQTVSTLLKQMRVEYFSDNNLRELLVYSHLLMLLTQLVQSSLRESREQIHLRWDKQKEYTEKYNEVLQYINDHYAENITLEQISKRFGFSKYHFSRLFHQYTTYHFIDYVTYRRLKAAELLLADSKLSITEISDSVGFNSPSTFSRAFKQKNHHTPSTYRQLFVNGHPSPTI